MKTVLWTIQHKKAFEELEKTGILIANEKTLMFQKCYDWMTRKMIEKIGEPPTDNIHYPIWAWYQWEGKRKRRDLRCSGYAERGTSLVQLTIEVEDKDFLLSDFDAWHMVLNNMYLADNERDFDKFYRETNVDSQKEIEKSWDKIFDLERYTPNWDTPIEKKSIQATLWKIEMKQVKKVEYFTAK